MSSVDTIRKNINRQNIFNTVFCLIGFIVTLIYFYPALVVGDSEDQYRQAISWSFNDWHPPILSAIWAVFLRLMPTSGGGAMVVLNLLLYWSSWKKISSVVIKLGANWYSLILLLSLSFFPPAVNFAGVIWKDCLMASFFLFSASILFEFNATYKISPLNRVLFFVTIFIATTARANGIVLIPFALYYYYHLTNKKEKNTRRVLYQNITLSALSTLALMILSNLLCYQLLNARRTFPMQYTALDDLAAISLDHDENFFPQYIKDSPDFSFERIKQLQPLLIKMSNHLFRSGGDIPYIYTFWTGPLTLTLEEKNYHVLLKNWIDVVLHHRSSYLNHRLEKFINFLKFKGEPYAISPPLPPRHGNLYGFYEIMFEWTQSKTWQIFYRSWFYITIYILMLIYSIIKLPSRVKIDSEIRLIRAFLLFLSTSSLIYLSTFVIFGQTADFRFVYPVVPYFPCVIYLYGRVFFKTTKSQTVN